MTTSIITPAPATATLTSRQLFLELMQIGINTYTTTGKAKGHYDVRDLVFFQESYYLNYGFERFLDDLESGNEDPDYAMEVLADDLEGALDFIREVAKTFECLKEDRLFEPVDAMGNSVDDDGDPVYLSADGMAAAEAEAALNNNKGGFKTLS